MTLAEFKRRAQAGNMYLELVERFGSTGNDIPERLRGVRKVIGANTVGVQIQTSDGAASELAIKSAKLFECAGEFLTVYGAGLRLPTPEEQALLDGWEKKQAELLAVNPYANVYWAKEGYFRSSPYPYMSGFESLRSNSKAYLTHEQKVMDKQLRGPAILKYRISYKNM